MGYCCPIIVMTDPHIGITVKPDKKGEPQEGIGVSHTVGNRGEPQKKGIGVNDRKRGMRMTQG